MGPLSRLDEAAARRWPRGLGYRSSPLAAALVFMVVGIVCLVVGGRAHAVGIGASGAAIGLMITALRRGGQSQPSRQKDAAIDAAVRSDPKTESDITGLAGAVLKDEPREPNEQ